MRLETVATIASPSLLLVHEMTSSQQQNVWVMNQHGEKMINES
jgi:hypothetical protein